MPRSAADRRAAEFAKSILTQNLHVKPGENVIIEGFSHSLPWAVALARETRRLKAFPLVLHEDEDAFWDSVDAREEAVLGAKPAHEWAALGKTDVYIHMWGAGDKVRFGKLPANRAEKIVGFNEAWYAAAHKAGLRGTRLEIGRPYPSVAAAYGVDEAAWRNQLIDASMVDPAGMLAAGKPIAKALEHGRRLRVFDDHGTDLTLGLAHRKSTVNVGMLTAADLKRPFGMLSTLPNGAVDVALDEGVADGTIVANRTCYYDNGKATGGSFEFRKGRLVEHHFETGSEFFDGPYAKGGRGRDQPGQFRIGLNPKLHDTPQLEDREAGAITVTVGGNRFTGGKNKSPFFGFVVNAGATVEIDGKRIPLPG
jgi:leucyl aminopeptidase (aminopeptidase T)